MRHIPVARAIFMVASFVLLVTKHEIVASCFLAAAVILSIADLLHSKKVGRKEKRGQ